MDQRSFAVLVLRLTGLAVVATVVTAFPNLYLHVAVGQGEYGALLPVLLLFAAALLGGLLLLWRPGRIATLLVEGEVGGVGARVDLALLQEVALVSIGVFLVCGAVLDGSYVFAKLRLYYILRPMMAGVAVPEVTPDDFAFIVTAFLHAAIGVGLLLGAKGGARVIAWLRA